MFNFSLEVAEKLNISIHKMCYKFSPENDGCGIIGYSWTCCKCGTETRFVTGTGGEECDKCCFRIPEVDDLDDWYSRELSKPVEQRWKDHCVDSDQLKCLICNEYKETDHMVCCEKHTIATDLCSDCYLNVDTDGYHNFIQGQCGLCIMEGNASLLLNICTEHGGNFYECASIGEMIVDYGMNFAKHEPEFKMPKTGQIIRSGGGDPVENIKCFRKLFQIGYDAQIFRSKSKT